MATAPSERLGPGEKLGPYEILALIGAGGMGQVYKARDTRLDRVVALKVSAAQFSERFEREAKVIASLNHPNICTLHDVGPNYLVMEFIEGTPLKGPLPLDQALKYSVQICAALDHAHQKGITHRDLKPGNIMVTASGIKLLDFGLAQLNHAPSAVDETATIDLTRAGAILGTPGYMSPEQAEAKPADSRSDIFSVGVILYEILSGRRAFAGESAIATIAAIVRDEPKPLDVSGEIVHVIARCLRKSSAERFQTAAELRAALEATAASKVEEKTPSIAVLPFANLSADKDNEYFSDGLAEEILNALSQVEGLKVAARTSSFFFKGKDHELSEVASKLKVATVLEGSVRRAGNRVRVTVQLVDVTNGFQLFSERYDRQMEDIFEVQDEIARAIAEKLKVTLSGTFKPSTQNLEAYELYLKGRYQWHQRSPSAVRMAMQFFEQAIQLDPQYALAYTGLADCYGILCVYGWMPTSQGRAPARAAMEKAITLAPTIWEANYSCGFYQFYFERNWRDAERHFQKAIAINPRSGLAQVYYGMFLAACGNAEGSIRQITLAAQLDPLSPIVHALSSGSKNVLGRFEEAAPSARRALELQPDYLVGLWTLGLAWTGLGRHEEATNMLERAVTLSRTALFVGVLGLMYGRAGRTKDATRLLHELEDRGSRGEFIPAFSLLTIYVGLGDVAGIRQTLSRAVADSEPPFSIQVTCCPFLQAYRSDPEIERLMVVLYGR